MFANKRTFYDLPPSNQTEPSFMFIPILWLAVSTVHGPTVSLDESLLSSLESEFLITPGPAS